MDNFLPQSGTLWAAVGSAFVLAVGGMYKAFRMIKTDLRDDRSVNSLEKWEEEKSNRIKDLEEKYEKSLERNDKLSTERNTAVEMTGVLQGDIKALTYRLEDLRAQKDKEITELRDDVSKLNVQNESLLKMNDFIKSTNK